MLFLRPLPAPLGPVRLLERERPMCMYESGEREESEESEEVEEVEEARRCRTIACGSMSGSLARRAKMERTGGRVSAMRLRE